MVALTGTPRLVPTFWDTAKLMEVQQKDDVKSIMESVMGAENDTAATGGILHSFHQCLRLSSQGILCYITRKGHRTEAFPLGTKESWLLVISASLQAQALSLVPDAPLSGHMGQKHMGESMRQFLVARDEEGRRGAHQQVWSTKMMT